MPSLPRLPASACAGGSQLDDLQGDGAHPRGEEREPAGRGGGGHRLEAVRGGGARAGQGERQGTRRNRGTVRELVNVAVGVGRTAEGAGGPHGSQGSGRWPRAAQVARQGGSKCVSTSAVYVI